MQEIWVPSQSWEDPLAKGRATHSSILACRIPWTEEPGRLQSMGLQRVEHNWATNTVDSWTRENWVQIHILARWSLASYLTFLITCYLSGTLSITNSRSLPKLMSIELVMPSRHLILYRPLLLLPPIPPIIRVFSNESTLHMRWPKYWSFSFNISPSNEHPGLISFRMDWLDLLAVQGTLKNLLQHHSSKASIFWCSAFFTVQLSHPYMSTGKTIALTRRTFVGKVMSLLFNMLSRLDTSLGKLRKLVMDREAWHSGIHGVTKSRTRLSDWTELKWF